MLKLLYPNCLFTAPARSHRVGITYRCLATEEIKRLAGYQPSRDGRPFYNKKDSLISVIKHNKITQDIHHINIITTKQSYGIVKFFFLYTL